MSNDTVLTDEQRVSIEGECHLRYASARESLVKTAIELTEQAILQSPEIKALRKDAERLDWLSEQEAQVQRMNKARGGPVYRIGWPDDGEYRFDWHSSPREAIDAAMEKQP